VELLAAFPLHATLWLTGNYTYNDTENASGTIRIRRPRHLSNVSLNWQPMAERLSLGLHVRGAWDAQDIDDSSTDDYQVVDLTASFDILDALEVFGRVENLFDADYEEVPTYNTSGTAAYAGIRYTF
jgi:vitamin B12 transporter